MLFDLSDLDPRGVELDRVVAVPPFAYEGDDVECGPVRLVGTLRPTRRGIEFAAEFETVAKLRCSRCLAPVELSLGERFRLFLVPPPAEAEDEAVVEPLPDDDPDAVDLFPLDGPVVDLAEVAREQVDLALPLRVLCRDDCRGLCPGCGADLNREACRCTSVGGDERFEGLARLKDALVKKRTGEDPSAGRS